LQANQTCNSKTDIEARIQSFADGVPAVSKQYWDNGGGEASKGPNHSDGGETKEACQAAYDVALGYIKEAYGYPEQVLFDPTLTSSPYRFRPTMAGALSYFMGTKCLNLVGDIQYPPGNDDGTMFFEYGFGLRNKPDLGQKGICSVTWETDKFIYNVNEEEFCETSVALGQMCFINCSGNSPVCVDKTFTFNQAPEGQDGVVFMGHHSSLSIGYESSSTSLVCQTAEPAKPCPTSFEKENPCIKKKHVESRIQSFADGVPAVSKQYWDNGGGEASKGPHDEKGGETKEACQAAYDVALGYIKEAYGYPEQVLFDPTLTTSPYRFRPTMAGALSYFMGTKCLNLVGDIQFPDGNSDGTKFFEYAFGLRNKPGKGQEGICGVTWDTKDFLYNIDTNEDEEFCHTAVALGQMCFINCSDNSPFCVDKTFTFNEAPSGEAAVFMGHHSSLSIGYESSSTSLVCQTAEPVKECPKTFEEDTSASSMSKGIMASFALATVAVIFGM
jgi:hypothetical protein